jgi:hypothetical protein
MARGIGPEAVAGHQGLVVAHRRADRHGGRAALAHRQEGGGGAGRVVLNRDLDVAGRTLGAGDGLGPQRRQERAVQARLAGLGGRPGRADLRGQFQGGEDVDLQGNLEPARERPEIEAILTGRD